MKAPFLLFLAACGGGNLPAWKSGQLTHDQQIKAKIVAAVVQVTIATEWEASPWFRIEDATLVFPVYLVVANDNTACFVPANDAVVVNEGDRYPCFGSWRLPRRAR